MTNADVQHVADKGRLGTLASVLLCGIVTDGTRLRFCLPTASFCHCQTSLSTLVSRVMQPLMWPESIDAFGVPLVKATMICLSLKFTGGCAVAPQCTHSVEGPRRLTPCKFEP